MMKRKKDSQSFIKFLAVIDVIIKNSDEKHALTVRDIQEKIYELKYDFSVDYRLIKKYVQNYNEYYDDTIIECYHQGRNDYYYFINTSLDTMEAKAIVDLVYSSDFFTLKTKENYKKRIQDMFSIHYQAYFNKKLNLHIVKNENDQVFYKELETIARAIHENKKIRFLYQKPSLIENSSPKKFEFAPIDTCFSNNEYYLLCQGAKNPSDCLLYRLDHIKDVEIIKDSTFFYDDYQIQCFHEKLKNSTYIYSKGSLEMIELDFHDDVYPNMIDKFGKNIKPFRIGSKMFRVQVQHIINSTFYSWIIGFGGKIQISGNQIQIKKFKEFLTDHFIDYQD